MSNYSYKDKLILIIATSVSLICLILTIYFAINRIQIQKVIRFQKVFVLDTTNTLKKDHSTKYDKFSYNPPLDPQNTNPQDWNSVAQDIVKLREKYNKVIVIMGGESLPYPASAISFMLENLDFPVIFTTPNLVRGALETTTDIPEVMVYDGENLLRATRTITTAKNRFISPNFPPLTKKNSFPKPKEGMKLYLLNPKINIAVIKVHPNMNIQYLNKIVESNINGVILELWGDSGFPLGKNILNSIYNLVKKGIIICSVGQYNKINNNQGNAILKKIGVTNLKDMTTSSAYGKFLFLLSSVDVETKVMSNLMQKNLRGEITEKNKMNKKGKITLKNKK